MAIGAPRTGVAAFDLDDLWSRIPVDDELRPALVVSLDALAGPPAIHDGEQRRRLIGSVAVWRWI